MAHALLRERKRKTAGHVLPSVLLKPRERDWLYQTALLVLSPHRVCSMHRTMIMIYCPALALNDNYIAQQERVEGRCRCVCRKWQRVEGQSNV